MGGALDFKGDCPNPPKEPSYSAEARHDPHAVLTHSMVKFRLFATVPWRRPDMGAAHRPALEKRVGPQPGAGPVQFLRKPCRRGPLGATHTRHGVLESAPLGGPRHWLVRHLVTQS